MFSLKTMIVIHQNYAIFLTNTFKTNKKTFRNKLLSLKIQHDIKHFLYFKLKMKNSPPLFLSSKSDHLCSLLPCLLTKDNRGQDLYLQIWPDTAFPHTEHSFSGPVINHRRRERNMNTF